MRPAITYREYPRQGLPDVRAQGGVIVVESCSWCCGDLLLLNSSAGPRAICADCGCSVRADRSFAGESADAGVQSW